MTTTHIQPGMRAALADPFLPIGTTTAGTVVYGVRGARGSSGVAFAVGDDEGDDPDFDDEDGDSDDEDDDGTDLQRAVSRRTVTTNRNGRRAAKKDRDEDPDDEGDQDDQGDDDGWTPPSRTAWDNMEAALRKANGEAGARRRVGKLMKQLGVEDPDSFADWLRARGVDPDTGDRLDDDAELNLFDARDERDDDRRDDDQRDQRGRRKELTDQELARIEARAETRAAKNLRGRYEEPIKLLAAESSLRAAGWNGKSIDLALRMVNPGGIEVEIGDDGAIYLDGIDEQIDAIKEEFPDWFKPKEQPRPQQRRRPTGAREVDGGTRGRQPATQGDWRAQVFRNFDQGR